MKTKRTPDLTGLGKWLGSWIQPEGSIYGFHNHSVWGDNPYRYGDFTCGHSTFASPIMPALAYALRQKFWQDGYDLLLKMIDFQTNSFQENGFYKHIGFQVGETLKHGLIHNVVPDVALSLTGIVLEKILPADTLSKIDLAVRKNIEACDQVYQKGPSDKMTGFTQSCCNQDYCRIWARLLHMKLFKHKEWDKTVYKGLNFMIDHFHIPGIPDKNSQGTLRVINDKLITEPAEYFGLMIHPLIEAYKRYNEKKFLSSAAALANHIMKSSWIDKNKCRRLHRYYVLKNNRYTVVNEPMLIGGMGMTLSSLNALYQITHNKKIQIFLEEMDNTYRYYQSRGGFFLAASGWEKECDIIPSTAWQSHDLLYLVGRYEIEVEFWIEFFTLSNIYNVVLGSNCCWIETGNKWALKGYYAMSDANIIGKKDCEKFFTDIPEWITGEKSAPSDFLIPDEPVFIRTDNGFMQVKGRKDINITLADKQRFLKIVNNLKQQNRSK